jgi:hypothetical protein
MLVFYLLIYNGNMSMSVLGKGLESERITSMREKVVNRIDVGAVESALRRESLVRGDLP